MMSGQNFLPKVFAALARSGLTYRWMLCYETNSGGRTQIFDRRILPKWKPVLWYVKGGRDDLEWIGDVIESDGNNDKRFHRWGQSEAQMEEIVKRVGLTGQIILDPFCGGGTTEVAALRLGRLFIGIDIDERSIAVTAERLKQIEYEAHQSAPFQPDCSECSRQWRLGSGAFARTTRHD